MKLRSGNPFDDPLIDLNFFSHPFDMEAIREGVRTMNRFFTSSAWDGYITGFAGPDPDALSDEEFQNEVKANARTFWHQVGTARMSSKNSTEGVVDAELNLKGATGLRIVDASVFVSGPRRFMDETALGIDHAFFQPYVPAAHTQAPVYILAERAVDLIRAAFQTVT